jgi:diadenosine tetraphosphate (Ap4A) HIT family hydrolase
MPEFVLHKQLEADSLLMRDLLLCQLRLQNQRAAPWLILVPRRASVSEIHHLNQSDRAQLIEEIAQTARVVEKLYAPDKINVGALGNIVPQLHVHVIARFAKDAAWPKPVWGNLPHEPYTLQAIAEIKVKLNNAALWDN